MTNDEKRMAGKITSMLMQLGNGYSLHPGMNGMFHILDHEGNRVTMGSIDIIYARVENMLKNQQNKQN